MDKITTFFHPAGISLLYDHPCIYDTSTAEPNEEDELYPINKTKNAKLQNSCLHKGAYILNKIPSEIKTGNIKKFTEKLKYYIHSNINWDNMTNI